MHDRHADVLSGEFARAGDGLRITIENIKPASGAQSCEQRATMPAATKRRIDIGAGRLHLHEFEYFMQQHRNVSRSCYHSQRERFQTGRR